MCSPKGEYPSTDPFPHGCGCINDTTVEVDHMRDYPTIRVLQIFPTSQAAPLLEATNSGWRSAPNLGSSPPSAGGANFSAVCWLMGRDLQRAVQPPRPIGLVEASLGGTPIEAWSSPEALAACSRSEYGEPGSEYGEPGATAVAEEHQNAFATGINNTSPTSEQAQGGSSSSSGLWNGLIEPLLTSTLKGVVWYQGEANTGTDGMVRRYQCQMKALVEDWRAKWSNRTNGASDPTFPFGWVQLNSNGGATTPGAVPAPVAPGKGDPLGAWNKGFAGLRWSQTNTLAAVEKTFQAVVLDTPAINGFVHSPFKQPVGARLARQALDVAYQMPQPSPRVTGAGYTAAEAGAEGDPGKSTVVVTLAGLGFPAGAIQVRQSWGFELLSSLGVWHGAAIQKAEGATLVLDASNATAGGKPPSALRYLWYTAPCTMHPYQCPVYVEVPPVVGGESGEMEYLPLAPHIMYI